MKRAAVYVTVFLFFGAVIAFASYRYHVTGDWTAQFYERTPLWRPNGDRSFIEVAWQSCTIASLWDVGCLGLFVTTGVLIRDVWMRRRRKK